MVRPGSNLKSLLSCLWVLFALGDKAPPQGPSPCCWGDAFHVSTLKARGAPTVLAALPDSDGHVRQRLGTDTHLKVSGFEKAQGPPGTTPPLSDQHMEAWWGQGWEGYTRDLFAQRWVFRTQSVPTLCG